VNNKILEFEASLKLTTLSGSIKGMPENFELVQPSRLFLHECKISLLLRFNLFDESFPCDGVTLVLLAFNDMIMICKSIPNILQQQFKYEYWKHVTLTIEPFPWLTVLDDRPSTLL